MDLSTRLKTKEASGMVLASDEGLTLELGILAAQLSRYIAQKNRDKAQATKSTVTERFYRSPKKS